MRIVSIVGARPQFVKIAPVSRAMADPRVTAGVAIEDVIVHTGQHYDHGMSDVFFDELSIPRPTINLDVGSGSHGKQTATMLAAIESALQEQKPDLVVIYGDTNSTLAGALAAAKMRIPVAHVEAGLRSFNRDMPEEINRIVADHTSDLLLAPTETAMKNLSDENLVSRSVLSGDVMLDAVVFNSTVADERSTILTDIGLREGSFAVATLHRASNTDTDNLLDLLNTMNRIASETMQIVFPVHPRTVAILENKYPEWKAVADLRMIEPVGYIDMLKLLKHARFALTDSGGLQKEALFLDTPCVTLRDETEWPETIAAGGNVLAGVESGSILAAVESWLNRDSADDAAEKAAPVTPFGDGDAAGRIVREFVALR